MQKKEITNKRTPDNIFISIFARIWVVWALLTFTITFLVIFIPSMISYLIPGIPGQRYFIWISRLWMNTWLPLAGCPLTIKGRENFETGKSYVVVFNHNALLDVPLSAPYVPGPNKTIAKSSFAKIPLFGQFYAKGSILVDRNSEKSRRKSVEEMKKVLQSGMHMCIYPEGTRNRTKEPIKQFYDGAFKLAVNAEKDVIPCVIFNTKKATPIDKPFYFLPTKLEMHFLPPVSSKGLSAGELKQKVYNIMLDHYCKK